MVKKNDGHESTEEISRQAALWWLLLKERRLSVEERWRFIRWLMRSRRHMCELILICRLDDRLMRGDGLSVINPELSLIYLM